MISLVIPLYNESESLRQLYGEIVTCIDRDRLGDVEMLFIDDGSDDGSWSVLSELNRQDDRVRVFGFRRNRGKAAALAVGFHRARGETILTLDADGQDDPTEIPRFLERLDAGYDVISGWKQVRHDPWHKVLPSRVFNAMVSRLTGCWLHDHNCGFKAYRREVVEAIQIYGERHRFIPVLAQAEGFRVGELVVHHRPRVHGVSKYGVARFLKGALDLVGVWFTSHFRDRPIHFFGTLCLLAICLGSLTGIVSVVLAVTNSAWHAGFAPLSWLGLGLLGGLIAIGFGLTCELIVNLRAGEHDPNLWVNAVLDQSSHPVNTMRSRTNSEEPVESTPSAS